MRVILVGAMLLLLSACMGSDKGLDLGLGISALDTTSEEDQENQKWFNSFYGNKSCYGMWGAACTEENSGGGGGGGGIWGGGVGPSSTGHGYGGNADAASSSSSN